MTDAAPSYAYFLGSNLDQSIIWLFLDALTANMWVDKYFKYNSYICLGIGKPLKQPDDQQSVTIKEYRGGHCWMKHILSLQCC